ncbi:unnamed protein product [Eruca vesicaria subsp. sativa]|uniref:Uncharacterized protein n=1 Tax=Eruca vesicaria subsp. sativa TaxID=29727 RepID=A0ABC8L0W3_ERUVS|nr:unnamed protein product [Eruca vesicaria subsp. sativa]
MEITVLLLDELNTNLELLGLFTFSSPFMVSVAKSFDAPIKLLFPTGDALRPYSMLGIGVFVALALRFDVSKRSQPKYFTSAFVGYLLEFSSQL